MPMSLVGVYIALIFHKGKPWLGLMLLGITALSLISWFELFPVQ